MDSRLRKPSESELVAPVLLMGRETGRILDLFKDPVTSGTAPATAGNMKTLSCFNGVHDSELVREARQGDRDAFGALVARHQSAVSAVAYSVCGDFAASEDIAQEAFVAAWKQLATLREPERFRAWLCGIARQLALNDLRRRARRGGRAALPPFSLSDEGAELVSPDESPRDTAVSAEEKRLLWRALDRLPAVYREPLVLFYREHQSVQATAEALGITEDAVKQRLSRGRVLLRDEVSNVLAGVLGATRPEVAFTLSVMAALPPIAGAVGAAAVTGGAKAAASGGGSNLLAGSGSALAIAVGSVVSGLMGLLGVYVVYRLWRSPWITSEARRAVKGMGIASFVTTLVLTALIVWMGTVGSETVASWGLPPGTALAVAIVTLVLANLAFSAAVALRLYELQGSREVAESPQRPSRASKRYCTRARFLGLPLVCVAIGPDPSHGQTRGVAKGWIAVGDVAYGGIIAVGGLALGPIAVGGAAAGIFVLAGAGVGAIGLGGLCVGWIACAGVAFAWKCAMGGLAIAFDVAIGGWAIARQWAIGGVGWAAHANDSATMAALQSRPFFALLLRLLPHAGWVSLIGLPSLLLVLRQLNRLKASQIDQ